MGKEEGQALADLLGALFIETSAKQVHLVGPFIKVGQVFVPSNLLNIIPKGKGVEEAFRLLSEEVLARLEVNINIKFLTSEK